MDIKEVKIAIIGYGPIGREVLNNTPFVKDKPSEGSEFSTLDYLRKYYGSIDQISFYFRVVGLADSKTYLYGRDIDLALPPTPTREIVESALAKSNEFRVRIEKYKNIFGYVKCLEKYLQKQGIEADIRGGDEKGRGGSALLTKLRDERLVPDIVIDATLTKNPQQEKETGGDTILERIAIATSMGSNVVLANKAPIAYHFKEVQQLSKANRRAIRCEATVGAEIPFLDEIIKNRGKEIFLRGIVNGTTNFILNEMVDKKQPKPYKTAFNHAKARNIAETYPGDDLLGIDAARKLMIIAKLAGKDASPRNVLVSGIAKVEIEGHASTELRPATLDALEKFNDTHKYGDGNYDALDSLTNAYLNMRLSLGYVPKLVAELNLNNHKSHGKVSLEWVSERDPLSKVEAAKNKILMYDKNGVAIYESEVLRGAGPAATTNAILLDCVKIASAGKPYEVTMF